MTVFGVIWLIIVAVCFCMKDIRYMIGVTLAGMLFQCNNVIELSNGISCGPQLITSFLFILRTMKYKKTNENKQKNEKYPYIIIFFIYIFLNLFIFYRGGFYRNIFKIIQLLIYVITFYRMKFVSICINEKILDKCIKIITYIIIGVGILQLCVAIFDLPRESIIKTLFYNDDSNITNVYYYKTSVRFYSTFMEPSFVAGLLVGLFMYFFAKKKRTRGEMFLLASLLIAILLTLSSTAYAVLLLVAMVYAMKNLKKKNTWTYILLGGMLILALALTTDVLDKVIFEKSSTASARVRNMWNKRAYNQFLVHPVFGNGYESLRASSIIFDILGELGVIGLVLYAKFYWDLLKGFFFKKESSTFETVCYLILAIFLSQVIACPDLNLSSFWIAIYIFGLATNFKNKVIEGENYEKDRNNYIS